MIQSVNVEAHSVNRNLQIAIARSPVTSMHGTVIPKRLSGIALRRRTVFQLRSVPRRTIFYNDAALMATRKRTCDQRNSSPLQRYHPYIDVTMITPGVLTPLTNDPGQ